MKITKKGWIAIISACAVVCGVCVLGSLKENISKEDIIDASKEKLTEDLGIPEINVDWEELKKEIKEEMPETTPIVTAVPEVTEISVVTTPADPNKPSDKPSQRGGNAQSYSPDAEQGLFKAVIVSVDDANHYTLDIEGGKKNVTCRLIGVNVPEINMVKNALEYIPEEEIENIDAVRQWVQEDKGVRSEDKDKVRMVHLIRNKLPVGTDVYIEFDVSRYPDAPSNYNSYVYMWYYANAEDRAKDKLTLFQEYLLTSGYALAGFDGLNLRYQNYFVSLQNIADENYAGLWNGFFKPEMIKENVVTTTRTPVGVQPKVTETTETTPVTEVPIESEQEN